MKEPWVHKQRVCEHFSVSPKTVERWVEQGCPIGRFAPQTHRFRISEIERWLAGRGLEKA